MPIVAIAYMFYAFALEMAWGVMRAYPAAQLAQTLRRMADGQC